MLWHGRRTVVAHGCRETKKIICGMEAENFVAFSRLPSSAHCNVKKRLGSFFSIVEYRLLRSRGSLLYRRGSQGLGILRGSWRPE